MEGSTFDRLVRGMAADGSRRGLLRLVAGMPLAVLLARFDSEDGIAKRKRHGRRRGHRPGKRKDNRKGKRKKKGSKGGAQCGATGSDCRQDSDCCSTNCFNLGCADKVHSCGSGESATACHPAANGCAGETCCYGEAVCSGNCCDGTANQCNPQGECCAPNCAGRSCGPDGCGAGGTCGSCPSGQTCDETTGQCQAPPPSPGCPFNETCSDGRCRCAGGGSWAPFTCCPALGEGICADQGQGDLVVADTCEYVAFSDGCPSGHTLCVATQSLNGSACQTCCPPGTTCDPVGGFCRQSTSCPPAPTAGTSA